MDPVTAATGVALGAAKGLAGAAGKQVVGLLSKRTMRVRVSRAVVAKAKRSDITLSRRELARWLGREDVKQRLGTGDSTALSSCAQELEALSSGSGHVLLDLIRDAILERLDSGPARVELARRQDQAMAARFAEHRTILTSEGDQTAFEVAKGKLHPWRSSELADLALSWPPIRRLAISITAESDRASLLGQWSVSAPSQLSEAPGAAWCWLGAVAGDYGNKGASLELIKRGIAEGAPASYWWARAGWIWGTGTPDSQTTAQTLWELSDPPHPLASAGLSLLAEDYDAAEKTLAAWAPTSDNDRTMRAILECAAATGRRDYNRAIAIGVEAAATLPAGSGIALRTAEALLARGHHGISDHPLDDFARAYTLAIQARDARRPWLGDSVSAILVAIKAAALATDISLAWKLTQPSPSGDALPNESRDPRLRREAAVLAAMTGQEEVANDIAQELGDLFVTAMVHGWNALADDRGEDAEQALLEAFAHAPDDISRLQAASALAPLGRTLPDLSTVTDDLSMAVAKIRGIHDVMATPGDRLAVLRARALDSEQLTVLLAEQLSSQGNHREAAEVLERGGDTWNQPAIMRMAADRYLSAGAYDDANRAATIALSLGGKDWTGRLQALGVQFQALEALGDFDRQIAVAREMVSCAPNNVNVRWALVQCLVRRGDLAGAWNALRHDGQYVAPRDAADARTWIGLAAECDDSSAFIQRALETMGNWSGDPDLNGIFLAQIYRGLRLHEREVAPEDLAELRKTTEQFLDQNPDSPVFRRISIDENDPLESLREAMRPTAEPPELIEIREQIASGQLPLGMLAEMYQRSYTEAALRRAAGRVFSHDPAQAPTAQTVATATFDRTVIIDSTAVATLAVLDSGIVDRLLGSFSKVCATDHAFRDALEAQQSLALRSTMSVAWDHEQDRPVVSEIGEEEADLLATQADRCVELLARCARTTWRKLIHFGDLQLVAAWLTAIDFAVETHTPLWCDDNALRALAIQSGAQCFGTVDLLAALESTSPDFALIASPARAALIRNFHVDLPFEARAFELAAGMDGWKPGGAAAALSRPLTWTDPGAAFAFLDAALTRVSGGDPRSVRGWVAAASAGLIAIAGDDLPGAAGNLRLLLAQLVARQWLRPDVLPFVVLGIRDAIGDGQVVDPLADVTAQLYGVISASHGRSAAAEFLLMLFGSLEESDRAMAARTILTASENGE